MEEKEILEKVIQKLVSNGFPIDDWDFMIKRDGSVYDGAWLYSLIFDHRFAKAFFGEPIDHSFYDNKCKVCDLDSAEWGGSVCEEGWKYHLQQMVLEEDPIKYLKKFI